MRFAARQHLTIGKTSEVFGSLIATLALITARGYNRQRTLEAELDRLIRRQGI
jgi:hypothetical protein